MLVLSRRRCESIMIGDIVEVRVARITGEQAWLDVIAPGSVAVVVGRAGAGDAPPAEEPSGVNSAAAPNARAPGDVRSFVVRREDVITVGDNVTAHVVEVREDRVRLGVMAPQYVPVHRGEIYDAIRRDTPHPDGH